MSSVSVEEPGACMPRESNWKRTEWSFPARRGYASERWDDAISLKQDINSQRLGIPKRKNAYVRWGHE
jgi:hypothetical protein